MTALTREVAALLACLVLGLAAPCVATDASAATNISATTMHGTRRAVLVGIDAYRAATPEELATALPQLVAAHMVETGASPPRRNFNSLDGAVNDARAMRELLMHRYSFDATHITELTNESATRAGILEALHKSFVQDAHDGDVLVFFYSGHGSQMRNSRSITKGDRIDETIVPWDANAGYYDIRDKELARIFNEALDAHRVTLTAIFDSCHSGSISRGLIRHKVRSAPEDVRDAADDYGGGAPENRGALILSAAQFDEEALEADDDSLKPAQPRGAFALSLMQAMQNSDPATPAIELFRAARSRLHTLGSDYTQEPVISGNPARQRLGLFGDVPGTRAAVTAQVTAVDESTGDLTLDAGLAIGLAPGAQFHPLQDPAVSIRVEEVQGFSQSRARIVGGGSTAAVQVNDRLQMADWSAPGSAPLRVWLPEGTLPLARLGELERAFAPLMQGNFHWVSDPTAEVPTHLMDWNGKQWLLHSPGGDQDVTAAGGKPDSALVARLLKPADHLLVLMPVPSEWQSTLQSPSPAVALTADRAHATYWLTGTLKGSSLAYAWTQPDAASADAARLTLPARTDWIASQEPSGAERLGDFVNRLGTVAGLLRLPESGNSDPFPYHLLLRPAGAATEISGTDLQRSPSAHAGEENTLRTPQVRGGEIYDLVLKADPDELGAFNLRNLDGRWVYVFVVDSTAHRDPLFVYSDQRARFPRSYPPALDDPGKLECRAGTYPQQAPLTEVCIGTIRVCPAYGTDTYFLLSSSQPIPDLSVFSGDGVRTAGRTRGADNALAALLRAPGGSTRGAAVPEQFSIERLSVLSSGRDDLPDCKE